MKAVLAQLVTTGNTVSDTKDKIKLETPEFVLQCKLSPTDDEWAYVMTLDNLALQALLPPWDSQSNHIQARLTVQPGVFLEWVSLFDPFANGHSRSQLRTIAAQRAVHLGQTIALKLRTSPR